jgi:4-hydroxybenzoate polyprenyltransferase
VRNYLDLLRPANVVTALADVLAGYAIAGGGAPRTLGLLLASTACLYAGGIVLNDVCDRRTDATERPERPIPSGRVGAGTAGLVSAGLLLAGVLFASGATGDALAVAMAIAAAVCFYDGWTKRSAWLGPLNMGLCRALNLLLGMAAVPGAVMVSWPLGILPLTYVAAVTVVSRGEVGGSARSVVAAALVAVVGVLGVLAALAFGPSITSVVALGLVVVFGLRILPAFVSALKRPEPAQLRRAVRAGVLSLVLLNAVLATTYAGIVDGSVIVAIGLAAGWLSRRFAVT